MAYTLDNSQVYFDPETGAYAIVDILGHTEPAEGWIVLSDDDATDYLRGVNESYAAALRQQREDAKVDLALDKQRQAAKASGYAKLLKLGMTKLEATAITGYAEEK